MQQRPGSIVFGLVVGLVVAFLSYQWITNPERGAERAAQEAVVLAARELLHETLAIAELEIVDPLSPDRKLGKVYIYPLADGWEVSGFYRRDNSDRWHPYLAVLAADLSLRSLKIQDADAEIARKAASNPMLSVMP